MLYDKARIFVQGGGGGDGCRSFRREAHVPRGGPDGGDGGRGGDVVLLCDDSLRDLQSFKRKAHYKARRGGHGRGRAAPRRRRRRPRRARAAGHAGRRLGRHRVRPRGARAGASCSRAAGRAGAATSASPPPRARRRASPSAGCAGEEGWVDLRLKLLADVGLVGLPNAGKSSLLSRLTRAAPKVADYPFTTLEPVLGTLESDDRQLVLADIPGLIEGASDGAGLGHDFLAHVERTRLLVHVLDLAPLDGSDPVANWQTIEHELAAHDPRLARAAAACSRCRRPTSWRPTRPPRRPRRWRAAPGRGRAGARDLERHAAPGSTSSRTSCCGACPSRRRSRRRRSPPRRSSPSTASSARRPTAAGASSRWGSGAFRVSGAPVERLLARFDVDNEEALAHIEHRLHRMGVVRALEAAGFEPGDDVEIGGVVFELDPG